MAKVRSPNYPNIPLSVALEAVRPAFKKENRNKMSRSVLAGHLGYTSLNGRALGKLGAIRAYGLIEGSGEELRISDDAIMALNAPDGSPDRQTALARMASKPTLFQELRKDFPDDLPSIENVRYSLVKRGFTDTAAGKAAQSFLSSMKLAAGVTDDYNPAESDDDAEDDAPPRRPPPPPLQNRNENRIDVMEGERELTTGMLAKGASFRLIVTGKVGVKEIDRLIKKLELDKEILGEEDDELDDELDELI